MLAKATLTAFTVLLMGASLAGFAQTAAQTVAANAEPEPKPKQPPRVVFEIPEETLNDTRPVIERPNMYDPSPEQIRDQALLDAIKEKTRQGDEFLAAENEDAALSMYREALDLMENSLLDINSYEVRFGIAMVAPAITQIYENRADDRAVPARERLETWNSCGLMASTSTPKSNFNPEKCGDSLTFELFRAAGG